jgi:LPS export ABC transporter protein LptC
MLNSVNNILRPGLRKVLYLLAIVFAICSCENNIQVINSITNRKSLPTISYTNVDGVYSDSGKPKFKLISREVNIFKNTEKPYWVFPKGLTVYLYDSLMQIETIIKAQYALYHESEKLWEARNDVEAKNLAKNEQINTEEMFWDQKKGIIYSDKFTRIVNPDGVFTGEAGFTANETLSWWKLKGIKGTVNIKDTDIDEQNP